MKKQCEAYRVDEIETMKLELACGSLMMREASETDTIRVEAEFEEDDKCTISVNEGTLEVNNTRRKQHIFGKGDVKNSITLWIPKEKRFSRISIQTGAGMVDLTGVRLRCDGMKAETGAGTINVGRAEIAESLNVEVGAGSVTIEQAAVRDMNVECGVGKCKIGVAGKEEEYHYDISCGVGKIQINDRRIQKMGGRETHRNESAIGTMRLDCAVGQIEIHTAE